MPVSKRQVERFSMLFDGNERSHGVWNPKNGKMFTQPSVATTEDYENHLNGKTGLGVVPINDANECFFGVVDIDNHGLGHDLPLAEVSTLAERARLPVIVARSKSGGIHCYTFCQAPIQAAILRSKMKAWAKTLGYPQAEIYPRQDTLREESDGSRQLGNWINLPYFNEQNTTRFAWARGLAITLDQFLDLAERGLSTEADLDEVHADHPEAPPCVSRFLADGVDAGVRNEAMYNIVVYMKRAFPENYRDRAYDANIKSFNPPLSYSEARRTIQSASRRDYKYKCDEEPCKSHCNRPVCLTKTFGVGSYDDDNGTNHGALPVFADLVQYTTDPVKWSVKMDGVLVDNLSTEDIMRYSRMEMVIIERLRRGAPMLKEKDWRAIVNSLLEKVRIIEAPDDASAGGMVRHRLIEFVTKAAASLSNDDFTVADRTLLYQKNPIVYKSSDGKEFIAFRGADFKDWLVKKRGDDLKGLNIYFAIKSLGLEEHNIRVGDQVIKCWCIPMSDEWKRDIKPITFHREF